MSPHETEAIELGVLQGLLGEMRVWPDGKGNLRLNPDGNGPFLQFDAYGTGNPEGDGWKLYTPDSKAWQPAKDMR